MADNVLDELKKLDAKREKLINDAKTASLDKANAALAELAALGFSYELIEKGAKRTASRTSSSGSRRTGIRDDILAALKSKPQGMKAAEVTTALGFADDKQGKQSVANALANMVKSNAIKRTGDKRNGVYTLPAQ